LEQREYLLHGISWQNITMLLATIPVTDIKSGKNEDSGDAINFFDLGKKLTGGNF